MKHEELLEEAQISIRTLFGDTSVNQSKTRESLESLKETIKECLDVLDESDALDDDSDDYELN